jgi:RNA polymerase sigma factor (sigma-70 family)
MKKKITNDKNKIKSKILLDILIEKNYLYRFNYIKDKLVLRYIRKFIEDCESINSKNRAYNSKRLLTDYEEKKLLIYNNYFRTMVFLEIMKDKDIFKFVFDLLNIAKSYTIVKEKLEQEYNKVHSTEIVNSLIIENEWDNQEFLRDMFVLNYESTVDQKKISFNEKQTFFVKDIKRLKELLNKYLNKYIEKDYLEYITESELQEITTLIINMGIGSPLFALLIKQKEKIKKGMLEQNNMTSYNEKENEKNNKGFENNVMNSCMYNELKFKRYYDNYKGTIEVLLAYNIKLIVTNVSKSMRKFRNNITFDDIKAEGIRSFLYAVQRFNVSLGMKLSTYVTWWIKEGITTYINTNKTMVTTSLYYTTKYVEYLDLMSKDENKGLSNLEIADKLEVHEKQLMNILKYASISEVSMSKPIGGKNDEKDSYTVGDTIIYNDDNSTDELLNIEILNELYVKLSVFCLTDKELFIFRKTNELFTKEPVSFLELSKQINITPARIRQISIDIDNKLIYNLRILKDNAEKVKISLKDYVKTLDLPSFSGFELNNTIIKNSFLNEKNELDDEENEEDFDGEEVEKYY